jgi:DNA-binding response OmpR family regulator
MKVEHVKSTRPHGGGTAARKPGVLIADHLALVLTLLKFELEARGYNAWLAVDGDDALDLYRRHWAEIDLVLLNVGLPGPDGPHVLDALRRLDPGVVVCFLAANPGLYTEEQLRGRGAAWVFGKPFAPSAVVDVVERLLSVPVPGPFVSNQYSRSAALAPCTERAQ